MRKRKHPGSYDLQCAFWSTCFVGSHHLELLRLEIITRPGTLDGDDLHLNCYCDVRVSQCRIEVQDNSFVIRANDLPLRVGSFSDRIEVTACSFKSECNAIRLRVGNTKICHVRFSHIRIHGSRYGVCFSSAFLPEREARMALVFETAPGAMCESGNLIFRNWQVTCCFGFRVMGTAASPVCGLLFRAMQISILAYTGKTPH